MNPARRSLRALTTFRIGGRPLFYCRPESYEELCDVLRVCRKTNLEFEVLGGGSNLLVDDYRLDFGVVHICNPGFNWIQNAGNGHIRVGGGTTVGGLLFFCRKNGLAGAEFLAGIPGTVGGAVACNAGACGSSMDALVRYITVVDRGGEKQALSGDQAGFSYRRSGMDGMIVTEVEMQLLPQSPALVAERIRTNLRRRKSSQPTQKRSAGCIFKNPGNESAGRLLDLCGFKGRICGGAMVSEMHANFICNERRAAAKDVLHIIDEMKEAVKDRFGIELQLEVRLWKRGENAKVA